MGYDQEPQFQEVTTEPVDEKLVAAMPEFKLTKHQYSEE